MRELRTGESEHVCRRAAAPGIGVAAGEEAAKLDGDVIGTEFSVFSEIGSTPSGVERRGVAVLGKTV